MPSRVTVVAKIVCVTTSSGPRPGTALSSRPIVTQPQTRQLHLPTQPTLLSTPKSAAATANRTVSLSLSSLHLSHRHQYYSTKMDAALAKLFVSNSQWVKAVNLAEPNFFKESAKKQSPKVRSITTFLLPRAAMVALWEETLSFLLRCTLCSWVPFVYYILTDPLARMLGLSRPRKRHNCFASRRYLRSPQHCEPSPPGRR